MEKIDEFGLLFIMLWFRVLLNKFFYQNHVPWLIWDINKLDSIFVILFAKCLVVLEHYAFMMVLISMLIMKEVKGS
jgi:hypothetical protein